jgi:hypothetical protein
VGCKKGLGCHCHKFVYDCILVSILVVYLYVSNKDYCQETLYQVPCIPGEQQRKVYHEVPAPSMGSRRVGGLCSIYGDTELTTILTQDGEFYVSWRLELYILIGGHR